MNKLLATIFAVLLLAGCAGGRVHNPNLIQGEALPAPVSGNRAHAEKCAHRGPIERRPEAQLELQGLARSRRASETHRAWPGWW